MSAPFLWIILPLILASLLLIIRNQKLRFILACLSTLFLSLSAWLIPIGTTISLRGLSLKLVPTMLVLGRNLTITPADSSFLIFFYGSVFFWIIPSKVLQIDRMMIPLGLAISSLLVAAISVEPPLYAALIIEIAVLLSIPLLTPMRRESQKGVLRYLIFQTLAVPFVLFSGWLLTGIGANPGNLALVRQAVTLLGFGFAFLLAIFPFYTWIPMLAEEAHPYVVGFLLWILPTATIIFGLNFLDRYTWLRDTPNLPVVLSIIGTLMIITGGLFSLFQKHLGRILGYAIIIETGFSLLAISQEGHAGQSIFFALLIPRLFGICLWAFCLSVLYRHASSLEYKDIKGIGRDWPLAASGLFLANLSLAGVPLLASFPAHQAVLTTLAPSSLQLTVWILLGNLGLFISGIRTLINLMSTPKGVPWNSNETIIQRLFISLGILFLFLLGLFPQIAFPIWEKLPNIIGNLPH